jgi:hypothetical protein
MLRQSMIAELYTATEYFLHSPEWRKLAGICRLRLINNSNVPVDGVERRMTYDNTLAGAHSG